MTAIVTLETEDGAWIGADSFYGHCGETDTLPKDTPKIFELNSVVFGVSGSLRMGQILKNSLVFPSRFEDESSDSFMFRLVNAIGQVLKEFDHQGKTHGQASLPDEGSSEILLLYKGLAYSVNGQFSFNRSRFGYLTSGSGFAFAKGALFATEETELTPEKRVKMALRAAAAHCPTVAAPFTVLFQPRS